METFSFNHSFGNVNTNVSFVVPGDGTTIETFAEMCSRAAKAFGYTEHCIENYIVSGNDAFMEFDEEDCECHCDCEECSCRQEETTSTTTSTKKGFGWDD